MSDVFSCDDGPRKNQHQDAVCGEGRKQKEMRARQTVTDKMTTLAT